MTEYDYTAALKDMPNIVGTPDTAAYKRSLENLLRWYDGYYKPMRNALKIAQRLQQEPSGEMLVIQDEFFNNPYEVRRVRWKAMVQQMMKEIEQQNNP
jgi:hypothetical protein